MTTTIIAPHTELRRERSRFYRAEEFANGQDEHGSDVAGWVGYYVDKRTSTGRIYTIEEMVPIRAGAHCDVRARRTPASVKGGYW